jgi:hypothetical protein
LQEKEIVRFQKEETLRDEKDDLPRVVKPERKEVKKYGHILAVP